MAGDEPWNRIGKSTSRAVDAAQDAHNKRVERDMWNALGRHHELAADDARRKAIEAQAALDRITADPPSKA